MPAAAEPAVRASDLLKTYRSVLPWAKREVVAVNGLSLDIPRGELFGLLGPNGAGKTTTIKIIAGLIVPDNGNVSFPAFGHKPQIGAVLEGSRNLYWRLSAWENIRYFGEIKGVPLAMLKRQATELLELFGLAHRRDAPAQTLSRGMQQKLAVALAFLGEPELLLLDEPTLGLDVASSLTIQKQLKMLCAERGQTIVITTHQMDVAQTLCRRVGIVSEGRIVANEQVANLVDHFRRTDYIARIGQADWQRLKPELTGFEFEEEPEERPQQVRLRFKCPEADSVYRLMEAFSRCNVVLLDFRQETPTLEDVFLSLTEGDSVGRASAPAMEQLGGQGRPPYGGAE
jgi:ABC-2 type transport system ATP-binding protein